MSIFTCLPSLLDFPTNPPTHPPLPRGVRRGAVWGGALVTRVMSGAAVLFQVTRVETIEFTRRVQLVWWDANAGVSLKNNFIICSERCSLADLDCLFQGRADIIKVPVRRLHFPFPEAHFLHPAYHRHPRTCVYLLLLFPSSSRTRKLHPLRLSQAASAAKFVIFLGHGDRRRGGGHFFLSEIVLPYSSVKPKAALARSEPTGGRTALSCLHAFMCVVCACG